MDKKNSDTINMSKTQVWSLYFKDFFFLVRIKFYKQFKIHSFIFILLANKTYLIKNSLSHTTRSLYK